MTKCWSLSASFSAEMISKWVFTDLPKLFLLTAPMTILRAQKGQQSTGYIRVRNQTGKGGTSGSDHTNYQITSTRMLTVEKVLYVNATVDGILRLVAVEELKVSVLFPVPFSFL